jgi:hypothetical protein
MGALCRARDQPRALLLRVPAEAFSFIENRTGLTLVGGSTFFKRGWGYREECGGPPFRRANLDRREAGQSYELEQFDEIVQSEVESTVNGEARAERGEGNGEADRLPGVDPERSRGARLDQASPPRPTLSRANPTPSTKGNSGEEAKASPARGPERRKERGRCWTGHEIKGRL